MNKHYKVVWSKVKGSYVVVSELAKNNGKPASTHSKMGQKLSIALSVFALCSGVFGFDVQAVDNSQGTNFVEGTNSKADFSNKSNYIIGTNNSAGGTSASNVILGDGRRVNNSNYNVVIGSTPGTNQIITPTDRVVVIGYNTHSKVSDGVAIGSNSVAYTKAGVAGYDPFSTMSDKSSLDDSAVWKSTLAAVSVGVSQDAVDAYPNDGTISNKVQTRQITNVAAGTKDTDAVNIAQFKKIAEIAPHYVSVSGVKGESLSNYNNDGATKEASVVIGAGATTTGPQSVVLGYKAAVVEGSDFSGQIAIGYQAKSKSGNAVAIGTKSFAEAGVAIGDYSNSKTTTAVALGQLSKANSQGSVSIGHMTSSEFRGVAIGQDAGSQQDNSTALGSYARANTKDSLASGYKAGTYSGGSVAVGSYASVFANTDKPISEVDYNKLSDDEKKQYAPDLRTINSSDAASRQYHKLADNGYGTAVGYGATVKSEGGLALGHSTLSDVENGVAIGKYAYAHAENGVALGALSRANTAAGVKGYDPSTGTDSTKDTLTWKANRGSISVGANSASGSTEITRQITNVAAGAQDTDAVNVAQLKAAKVSLVAGANISSISTASTPENGTTYTINAIDNDTKVTGGTATYNQATGAGTITVTDSSGNTTNSVTITGLQDTYVTGAKLENGTLTLARNAGGDLTVNNIATKADLAAIKGVEYFSVNSTETGNKNNAGATGTNAIAIGPKVTASGEGSVAIGFNNSMAGAGGVVIGRNTRTSGDSTVIIGDGAGVDPNIGLDGHIAIGKNARVFAGGGEQEAKLGFDPTNWPKGGSGGYDNPTDRSRVATGIAMGVNAKGRTGSIDIGGRTYNGLMGDKQVKGNDAIGFHVNQTAVGTNTYAKGLFSTMLGSYSIATGSFDGSGRMNTAAYGAQNFGATVVGSLNSIRSNGSGNFLFPSYEGIANTITGVANITDKSNGSLIYGAGNKISNSITSINAPTSGVASVDAMVDTLQSAIRSSKSGGATMAFGGGNVADYTRRTAIIGVNNTVTGTASNISESNAITGFENTATNVDNVTVTGSNNKIENTKNTILFGDNRKLTSANNSVVMGAASKETELKVTDATVIGYNANVTVKDGVALGSGSIASIANNVAGYDPVTGQASTKTGATWKSTLGSVSVGVLGDDGVATQSRQITGVAAGMKATDAVNVAQLQAMADAISESASGAHTAITVNGKDVTPGKDKLGESVKDNNLEVAAVTKDGKTTYDIKLSKELVIGSKGEPGKPGENGEPGTPGKDAEPGSITIIGTPGPKGDDGQPGKDTSANISVKDGVNGLDGENGVTRIVYTDEDGKEHQVATMGDGLKFAGDDGAEHVIAKKLNEQLDLKGGAKDFTENNIAVVADVDDEGNATGLHVKLAKNINLADGSIVFNETAKDDKGNSLVKGEDGKWYIDLTGAVYDKENNTYTKDGNPVAPVTPTISGTVELTQNGLNNGGNKITNVANGTDATDAINKGQLDDAIKGVNTTINASKAQSGKNITVDTKTNEVNLNDSITLGSESDKTKQVTVDGNGAKVTAGDGTNKVVVDGSKGQVVIGDGADKVTVGNKYITGLDNTTWAPGDNGENIVADRAATEGQLHDLANQVTNQINEINTSVKESSRVFAGDEGEGKKVTVKSGETLHLNGGAAVDNLSDGNIGVVTQKDDEGNSTNGLDIKLSKDLKGLNSVTTKELTVTEKANIGDVTIEGDTITVGKGDNQTIINGEGISIPGKDGKDGVNISGEGIDMGGNPITNVGEAVNPGDAINKGQFDNTINNIGNGMNQMSNRISKLDRRVDRVGAGAAALAALHPLEFSPEAKWEVSAGVGNYRGANALALGAFYRPNGDTMFSIGTSLGGGENMVNAGVTLRVGEGETENYPARKVMAQQIKDLQTVVDSQNAKIEELTQLVNTLVQNAGK